MKTNNVLNIISIVLMVLGIIDLLAMNFISLDASTIFAMRMCLGAVMVLSGLSLFIEKRLRIKSTAKIES